MSNHGDDCYFFFYSTCTKGDSCAFRHCEAALGNETVCNLWQEGRCFRQICKFRHMEIDKKRSEIPCYWENQLSGCQKANCAFHHAKGRFVDGTYIPPSKAIEKPEPCKPDVQTTLQSAAPTKLSVTPTPQLRGVKKIEATENVPSPTHPPVVINAADDDEDDDDLVSEEGEEMKNSAQHAIIPGNQCGTHVISSRKSLTPKKVDLNYGIKTLKEIKSEKQKDQEKSKDDSIASPEFFASSYNQTENSISVLRTVKFTCKGPVTNLTLAQRLGKRQKFQEDSPLATSGEEALSPTRKTLSERLGKRITSPNDGPEFQQKKVRISRPLKDRLGMPSEHSGVEMETTNTGNEFRIKTLQEIRQEKANQAGAKRQEQEVTSLSSQSENKISIKRKLSSKPQTAIYIKSLSEIQEEKRLRQLKDGVQKHEHPKDERDCNVDKEVEQKTYEIKEESDEIPTETKQKQTGCNWKVQGERRLKRLTVSDSISSNVATTKPLSVALKRTKDNLQSIEKVKVKTLEEIRQEKALRLQQTAKSENVEFASQALAPSNQKKILRLSKPQGTTEKLDQSTAEPNRCALEATREENKTSVMFSMDTKREKQELIADSQLSPMKDGGNVKALRPTTITLEKRDKPKLNVEPCVVKNTRPVKAIVKQKAQERTIVAEVKPMSSSVTCTEVQKVSGMFAESSEESSVDSLPPKRLKISSQANTSLPSVSATVQPPLKSPRTSTASVGKTSVPAEDEFDELMWEISDDKLEAELDLDSNKDEDALLLELSKMIDS